MSVLKQLHELLLSVRAESHSMSLADLQTSELEAYHILVELRSSINTFSTIDQLPSELLMMIFEYAVRANPQASQEGLSRLIDTQVVLDLTHVCRHWRTIARGVPGLWAQVDAWPEERLATFAELSDPLPMRIFVNGGHWMTHERVKELAPHLERLDVVEGIGSSQTVDLLKMRAPQLECLSICIDTRDMERWCIHEHAPRHVEILEGHADMLKGLSITSVHDWIPSTHFGQLTHLRLDFHYLSLVHSNDILMVLANAPKLQFLHVKAPPLKRQRYEGSWQPRDVVLTDIRTIVFVNCNYYLALEVVYRLSLPPNIYVRYQKLLVTSDSHPKETRLPKVFSTYTTMKYYTRNPRTNALLIIAQGPDCGFWLQVGPAMPDARNVPVPIKWNLYPIRSAMETVTTLTLSVNYALLTFLLPYFPSLTELNAIPDARLDLKHVGKLFERCPHLHTLRVRFPFHEAEGEELEKFKTMMNARVAAQRRLPCLVLLRTYSWELDESEENLIRYLRTVVDNLTVLSVDEVRSVCSSTVSDVWDIPGSEKYWDMDEDSKPVDPSE